MNGPTGKPQRRPRGVGVACQRTNVLVNTNGDKNCCTNPAHTWRTPSSKSSFGSPSASAGEPALKHRLALVVNGYCVMRDDNEAGKGLQARLVRSRCLTCRFEELDKLMQDFDRDVTRPDETLGV